MHLHPQVVWQLAGELAARPHVVADCAAGVLDGEQAAAVQAPQLHLHAHGDDDKWIAPARCAQEAVPSASVQPEQATKVQALAGMRRTAVASSEALAPQLMHNEA